MLKTGHDDNGDDGGDDHDNDLLEVTKNQSAAFS